MIWSTQKTTTNATNCVLVAFLYVESPPSSTAAVGDLTLCSSDRGVIEEICGRLGLLQYSLPVEGSGLFLWAWACSYSSLQSSRTRGSVYCIRDVSRDLSSGEIVAVPYLRWHVARGRLSNDNCAYTSLIMARRSCPISPKRSRESASRHSKEDSSHCAPTTTR